MMKKDRSATSIEDIFEGRWSGEEYVVRCPVCSDHSHHNHCSINVKKGVFKCFYCGASGKLKWFIKKYAGDKSLSFPNDCVPVEKQRASETPFSQFREFFLSGLKPDRLEQKAWNYLQVRGISSEDVEHYHLRWASQGRYFGRVILPVIEEERIVCWSARAFLKFLEPKYLFPHYGETLLTCSEAIFGYDRALHSPVLSKSIVLVEGIFDAIAVDKALVTASAGMFSLSILSKTFSDSQLMKLLKFDGRVVQFYVMMDPDAEKEGVRIAKKLFSYGRLVRMCYLKGAKDPGEATPKQILAAISNSVLYNDNLELMTALGLKGET